MVVEMSFHVDPIAALRPKTARFCRLTGCIAALRICLSTERENYRSAGESHKHRSPARCSGMAFWFVDKPRSWGLLGIGFPVVNQCGETRSRRVLIRCVERGA